MMCILTQLNLTSSGNKPLFLGMWLVEDHFWYNFALEDGKRKREQSTETKWMSVYHADGRLHTLRRHLRIVHGCLSTSQLAARSSPHHL